MKGIPGKILLTLRSYLKSFETPSKKLKKTEMALEQSERHFQVLFNNFSDDIFVMDPRGSFIEVNKVACDNLGYSREDLLNMHARDIKPGKFRDEIDTKIGDIIKFGKLRFESANITRTGKIIPVETKSRVIDFKGEKAILSIARDISERKEMEDKILHAIVQTEENERKRFAADLHDDLGPILSTIKLYADLIKNKNFKNTGEEEATETLEELVDNAISLTRTISRNIRPNILQDFGLAAAIRDFCEFISKTDAPKIELMTEEYTCLTRGIEEWVLYQAVKELINNTIKHASATKIKIELKSFDNQIILYYRDDGLGFDLDRVRESTSGFGLSNIVNKLKSVKGEVDINTSPDKGMFLIASIKIKSKDN